MDFIQILEKEHKEIQEIFDAIDLGDDLEHKKPLIQKLLLVLVPHLKKEDEQLYPTLEHSNDAEVRRMASIFSLTMGEYSKNFVDVIDHIMATTGAISKETETEYEIIRDKIKDRIVIEEVTVFPAYKKIIQ